MKHLIKINGETIGRAAFWIGAGFASLMCGSALAGPIAVPAASDTPIASGVAVTPGQTLAITASGSAGLGYEGLCGCFPTTFPDGSRFDGLTDLGPKFDAFAVLLTAPVGALIAKIGPAGPWFFVGDAFVAPVQAAGEVFLLYNDAIGTYSDNSGSYTASVSAGPVDEPASLTLTGLGLMGLGVLASRGQRTGR